METTAILKSLLALLFVVGLIGLTAFLLKRYVVERNIFSFATPATNKKRLKIVEQLLLDSKRRMVIVEKDGKEEITLVLGPNSETLVSVSAIKAKK